MAELPTERPDMKTFETGAVRSRDADNVRYDLITPIGLRRLAETYAEGARKYGANNWRKGIPSSDLVNHAVRHIYLWLSGDNREDHLAHAVWNLMTCMHFEETRPELLDSRNAVRQEGIERLQELFRDIGACDVDST